MKTLIMQADDHTTELKNLITGAVDQTTELRNQSMGLDDQTTGLRALPARPVLGVQCLPHQQPADQRSDHQPPPPPRDQLFNPRRHHHHHPHDLHTSLQRFRRLCFIRYLQRRLLCLTSPLFFQHRQSGKGCSLKLCFFCLDFLLPHKNQQRHNIITQTLLVSTNLHPPNNALGI